MVAETEKLELEKLLELYELFLAGIISDWLKLLAKDLVKPAAIARSQEKEASGDQTVEKQHANVV